MAEPRNRAEMIAWVRRELGEPVIDLNIADEQIDDRIDDAYKFWSKYHHSATRRHFIAHQLTQDDVDGKCVQILDEDIVSVNEVHPIHGGTGPSYQSDELFDTNYQYRLEMLWDMNDTSLTGYVIARQHIALLNNILGHPLNHRFSDKEGIVFIDTNRAKLRVGSFVVLDCHRRIPLEDQPRIWKDDIFRRLCAAYSRLQWGRNLQKMAGIQLPGGVTLDGSTIVGEADKDIAKLEEEFLLKYQAPDMFFLG